MNKYLLITIFLLLGTYFVSSQNSVLDQKISINVKNSDIKNILQLISTQTKYYFTYPPEIIPLNKTFTHKYDNSTVREVLDDLLNNENKLKYKVIEDHILICENSDKPNYFSGIDTTDLQILIDGKVLDKQTKEPLSFVSVGVYNTTTGTVTNQNGEFNLKIPRNYADSILFVGRLGYGLELLPIKQLQLPQINIYLEEELISIQEVIVKGNDPVKIIKKARDNISINYPQQPYLMKAFYREGVFNRKDIVSFSEAVIDIVKAPYKGIISGDKIFVNKSRKIVNTEQTDTVFVKLQDGLYTSLKLDFIKNPLDFFDEGCSDLYKFSMVDIITSLNREVYVIEFEQKEHIKDALFKGKLYIDMKLYAVAGAEFEINFKYNTENLMFISKKSKGFTGKPLSVKYVVSYRQFNDRYILNRVRADLVFKVRKKKEMFSSEFRTFFDMIILNAEVKTDDHITKENLAQKNSVFIDNNYSYDPDFWGKDNYIKPEKDIEDALNEINAKLQFIK
jgi:hypothetical protein